MSALLQAPPAIHISPHISFGLQSLCKQSPAPAYWSHAAHGLPDQATQPFAALGLPAVQNHQHPGAWDHEKQQQLAQPFRFRQIEVRNNGIHNLHLVDVRFSTAVPALPHTFALADDHQLSQQAAKSLRRSTAASDSLRHSSTETGTTDGIQSRASASEAHQRAELTEEQQRLKGVLLGPGQQYQVTLALHCGDGPPRK